jgi:hypothetical protein
MAGYGDHHQNSNGEHRGMPRRDDRDGFQSRREGSRPPRQDDRGDFRPRRDDGRPARTDRPSGGDRTDRGPRQDWAPREDRGGYQQRPARGGADRAPRQDRGGHDERPQRRRESGPKAPPIDKDVTGKELDRPTLAELRTLEAQNATRVAQHLVMAGRYLDDDPKLAFAHASAAAQSGGRVSLVREAVGVTAYAAGDFATAIRELRTFRRISGSNIHLPLMADCERGLGRPEKALELAHSDEVKDLDTAGRVEMAIVESGAYTDREEHDQALAALDIPQLDINKGFSYSPRLFRAYGEALTNVGRAEEAQKWFSQAVVAERALGIVEDDEDDVDFYDAEEEFDDTQNER